MTDEHCECCSHEHANCECASGAVGEKADSVSDAEGGRGVLLRTLLRFSGIWLAVALLFGTTSVCPFCGQHGCPVGAGSAGVLGGVAAFVLQGRKLVVGFFKKIFRSCKSG